MAASTAGLSNVESPARCSSSSRPHRQADALRFVTSESTNTYFEALDGYLTTHGCPVAFYSDKHSVFRVNKSDAQGGSGMT